MTWTATSGQNTLISDGGNLTNVVLNNGTTTLRLVDVPNDGTAAGLAAGVKARVAARDATSGVRQFVAIGTVLDLTTPAQTTAPASPAPSPADLARAQWAADYGTYRRYQNGLSLGLSGYDQATSDSKLAALRSSFDPSYDDLLSL